ncbi:protein HIRA homolog [Bradysia coprophila]|uniref:protein HIRA homolog n=1 Tax=Bradysia coprophila TaxID=38358 RepID=UPI00187DB27F|nr:protein HIRA homolog [Bradysia coprophila]
MKFLKPDWVHHNEKPIFSIDVHPDGTKFATGGQGSGPEGLVVIWNLKPVLSPDAEFNKSVPKMLCRLENHLACVNCVRWSMNGTFLASGGDDKVVMIWKKGKGPSAVFGNSGITKTTENWRCVSTLRGHAGDILDLAWSPHDRWLGTCSVDNNVIIWDMHNPQLIVAILKGHSGLVKGITWDPVGKFVASQSDDRSVKIWKTSDWTCQSTITEPFEDCGGTTHVLRLSWSPDGLYLVSAHAMNGGGPTAQIIEREGWKCDKDFVGHRKAVTCVRFHNSILKRQTSKANKAQQYCCLAVGSRDRALSIWMTALKRPLVVIYDLFQDSILDLSWSTDGHILLACSTDGTIACLQFSANELGKPLSEEDKNSLYQRMYGKSANIDMVQPEKDVIIEYPELVNVAKERPTVNHSNEIRAENNVAPEVVRPRPVVNAGSPKTAIPKQIETRTADGKRRITPMFIPLNQEEVSDTTQELNSSSRSNTNMVVDEAHDKSPVIPQQLIAATTTPPQKRLDHLLDNRLTKQAPIKSNNMPKPSPPTATSSGQSKCDETFPIKLNSVNAGKAVPLKGAHEKALGEFTVKISNTATNTSFGSLSLIACNNLQSKNELWKINVGSSVVNFCLSQKYVLACSSNGTLRFLDIKTGICILPVIKLPTAAVQSAFSINSEFGGIVTECGSVRIWNVPDQSIYIACSCKDLLTGSYVAHFHITENGVAFVMLSNGCSYSYSRKLDSWLELNSRDPVTRYGLSTTPSNPVKNIRTCPLGAVQSTANSFQPTVKSYTDITTTSTDWQHVCKLSFIENQIKICEEIQSPMELQYWYAMLGSHLASHGTEKRIRFLLDDLLGPTHSFVDLTKMPDRSILGISKHTLLEKVLEHFKLAPRWQRIYMEYTEQLSEFQQSATTTMDCDDVIGS